MARNKSRHNQPAERAPDEVDASPDADVVPSHAGVPTPTGLSAEDLKEETSEFFDEEPLDPEVDKDLIRYLTSGQYRDQD
jgi:hypothetical protein